MYLNIIDVNSYLHYGTKSNFMGELKYKDLPIGGLVLLQREIINILNDNRHLVLCFDSATDRKKYLPEYKSNREKCPEVLAQVEFAYEFYKSCGLVCEKEYGFEADDLIYSYCEKFRPNNNIYEINIFTGDKDIAHNIIEKEIIRNVSPNLPVISRGNWYTNTVIDGIKTPFNLMTFRKILIGDSSDTIKAFKTSKDSGMKIYTDICSAIGDRPNMAFRNKDFVKKLDSFYLGEESVLDLNEEESKNFQNRVEVFFPRMNENIIGLPNLDVMDYTRILNLTHSLRDYTLIKRLVAKPVLDSTVTSVLDKYSYKYKNYEYHVDSNVNIHAKDDDIEILEETSTFIRGV